MKKIKWLWTSLAILTIVGGIVHLLQPLGVNLLTIFGSYSNWVQGIAGIATIIYVIKQLVK